MKPTQCVWAGLLVLFCIPSVLGQSVGSWTAHTSAREVTSLSSGEGFVWVASTGGIFRYDPESGEIDRYTAAEGLYDVNVQAITWDSKRQLLWVGYADGVFDRLNPTSGQVDTFFDIFRSERFPSKVINELNILGDSLLIATGFGLVIFDPVRNEVRDTYSRLGSLPAAIAVNDVIAAEIPSGGIGLWVATDEGIAYAPLRGKSLQDPNSWVSEADIIPSSSVTSIMYHHDQLYVGTALGLGRRRPDASYESVVSSTRAIRDLDILGDRLVAVTQFRFRAYDSGGRQTIPVSGFDDLRSVATDNSGNVWLGDAVSGLNHYVNETDSPSLDLISGDLYPEGPFDSPFGDLTTAPDGSLWAAAQLGISQSGFYRMDPDGIWTNFTTRFVEELSDRGSFWRVHVDGMGNAWSASRGGGLARVSSDGEVSVFDQTNSTLLPASGTQGFVIVGGIGREEDGTLWVTNTISPTPLHVRTADGSWTALPPPQCGRAPQTSALGDIFIDSNGIKWIILRDRGNLNNTRGILILDTNATPSDISDDQCTYYSTPGSNGTGLPGSQIYAITEDLSGRVWVGTSGGPAYFQTSSFAATGGSTEAVWPVWQQRELGTFVLRGLPVHDVVVDPSNRLWMATPDGVYLISENGGFGMQAHYTTENSPLLSDMVTTIAVEELSGRVFLGTDKGLISLLSDAIKPAERTENLFIYPNPVQLSSDPNPQIYIEGLVAETELSILAVHGELVRRFQTRGGRGLWDGRDQDGKLVPSGMYLIVALGKNNEGVAYGKVAIIN